MEIVVDVVEAAERLEELIERACAGGKVSISVDGIPMAMLVPLVSLEEFLRLANQAEPESQTNGPGGAP